MKTFDLRSWRRVLCLAMVLCFTVNSTLSYAQAAALGADMPWMPQPGTMVSVSETYTPAHLKGMVIHPNDPFKFDFIIFRGDKPQEADAQQAEYQKLIKYFLAALATPDTDQWVNLSPYEQDRIIPDDFGLTEMGRDLLAQDYLLKQIASSLTNPDSDLGRKFWDGVYEEAYQKFGTTDIPTDTFNKVWIIPDKAVVYEKDNTVFVMESHLKVMTETDYLALSRHPEAQGAEGSPALIENQETNAGGSSLPSGAQNDVSSISSSSQDISLKVMREVIIPAIEREVNEGQNFAPVRQVYSGMLLATWYKRALKESILGKVYADQAKVKGIDQDPATNQEIYQKYVEAFKVGVFNMIKEDVDRYSQEIIPRKYFSGGLQGYDTLKKFDQATPGQFDGALRSTSTSALILAAVMLMPPAARAGVDMGITVNSNNFQKGNLKGIRDSYLKARNEQEKRTGESALTWTVPAAKTNAPATTPLDDLMRSGNFSAELNKISDLSVLSIPAEFEKHLLALDDKDFDKAPGQAQALMDVIAKSQLSAERKDLFKRKMERFLNPSARGKSGVLYGGTYYENLNGGRYRDVGVRQPDGSFAFTLYEKAPQNGTFSTAPNQPYPGQMVLLEKDAKELLALSGNPSVVTKFIPFAAMDRVYSDWAKNDRGQWERYYFIVGFSGNAWGKQFGRVNVATGQPEVNIGIPGGPVERSAVDEGIVKQIQEKLTRGKPDAAMAQPRTDFVAPMVGRTSSVGISVKPTVASRLLRTTLLGLLAVQLSQEAKAITPEAEAWIRNNSQRFGGVSQTMAGLNQAVDTRLATIFGGFVKQNGKAVPDSLGMTVLPGILNGLPYGPTTDAYKLQADAMRKAFADIEGKTALTSADKARLKTMIREHARWIQEVLLPEGRYGLDREAMDHVLFDLIYNCRSASYTTVLIAEDMGNRHVEVTSVAEDDKGKVFSRLGRGSISADQFIGIDGNKILKTLVDQGWASQKSPTEVRITVDLDSTADSMAKVFGAADFQNKILPVLQTSSGHANNRLVYPDGTFEFLDQRGWTTPKFVWAHSSRDGSVHKASPKDLVSHPDWRGSNDGELKGEDAAWNRYRTIKMQFDQLDVQADPLKAAEKLAELEGQLLKLTAQPEVQWQSDLSPNTASLLKAVRETMRSAQTVKEDKKSESGLALYDRVQDEIMTTFNRGKAAFSAANDKESFEKAAYWYGKAAEDAGRALKDLKGQLTGISGIFIVGDDGKQKPATVADLLAVIEQHRQTALDNQNAALTNASLFGQPNSRVILKSTGENTLDDFKSLEKRLVDLVNTGNAQLRAGKDKDALFTFNQAVKLRATEWDLIKDAVQKLDGLSDASKKPVTGQELVDKVEGLLQTASEKVGKLQGFQKGESQMETVERLGALYNQWKDDRSTDHVMAVMGQIREDANKLLNDPTATNGVKKNLTNLLDLVKIIEDKHRSRGPNDNAMRDSDPFSPVLAAIDTERVEVSDYSLAAEMPSDAAMANIAAALPNLSDDNRLLIARAELREAIGGLQVPDLTEVSEMKDQLLDAVADLKDIPVENLIATGRNNQPNDKMQKLARLSAERLLAGSTVASNLPAEQKAGLVLNLQQALLDGFIAPNLKLNLARLLWEWSKQLAAAQPEVVLNQDDADALRKKQVKAAEDFLREQGVVDSQLIKLFGALSVSMVSWPDGKRTFQPHARGILDILEHFQLPQPIELRIDFYDHDVLPFYNGPTAGAMYRMLSAFAQAQGGAPLPVNSMEQMVAQALQEAQTAIAEIKRLDTRFRLAESRKATMTEAVLKIIKTGFAKLLRRSQSDNAMTAEAGSDTGLSRTVRAVVSGLIQKEIRVYDAEDGEAAIQEAKRVFLDQVQQEVENRKLVLSEADRVKIGQAMEGRAVAGTVRLWWINDPPGIREYEGGLKSDELAILADMSTNFGTIQASGRNAEEAKITLERTAREWIVSKVRRNLYHYGREETIQRLTDRIQAALVVQASEMSPGFYKAIRSVKEDAAMALPNPKGGIDLNAASLDLQIKRDGNGVPLPVSQQNLDGIKIDGLVPVILDIKPAVSMPLFANLAGG